MPMHRTQNYIVRALAALRKLNHQDLEHVAQLREMLHQAKLEADRLEREQSR